MFNSFWSEPEWVSRERIRHIFNSCQYYERVLQGELRQRIWGDDNHLKRRQRQKLNEPRCTRSQIVIYYDPQDQPLALVHQYRRKTGELGVSGKPDPKRLFISGKVIAVRESP
ncbi:hypothetical protein ES703_117004 [subsurface metagenome]